MEILRNNLTISAGMTTGLHVDNTWFTPGVSESWHVDRIIMALGQVDAGADNVTKVRIYTVPDDIAATSLSATVPDDEDVNVWFKQVIFHGIPIYVSWRPKRTVRRGEVLYLDLINTTFQAAYSVKGYAQALYHVLP